MEKEGRLENNEKPEEEHRRKEILWIIKKGRRDALTEFLSEMGFAKTDEEKAMIIKKNIEWREEQIRKIKDILSFPIEHIKEKIEEKLRKEEEEIRAKVDEMLAKKG